MILGLPVDAVDRAQALERCAAFLHTERTHQVITANPEFVVHAWRQPEVRRIALHSALVVADGVGLRWAARTLKTSLPERIPGVELFLGLCRIAAREGKGVYLLGGRRGVAALSAERLRREIPRLDIRAFPIDHAAVSPPLRLWDDLRRLRPALLAVAYGQPQQELWIDEQRARLEAAGVRLAIGVGGTFDLLAGELPRAPRWLRGIGLEWLWRLGLEPRRLPRAFRAVCLFPLLVLRERVRL